MFYPLDPYPFVLLLALPGDDVSLEDFVGFWFDGSMGVQINPGIWHQPAYPIHQEGRFMTKQGAVHACVVVDTLNEFGIWLELSLKD